MKKHREAYQFLEQPEKIDAIIKNKLIEQQQWREIALGITSNMGGEKVQSSGKKSKMADAVERCVDMEAEINRQVDRLVDVKKEVIRVIESLSPAEYKLLHLRYIQYVPLNKIAELWNSEYTNVTTTHGRAVAHVQEIIEKK